MMTFPLDDDKPLPKKVAEALWKYIELHPVPFPVESVEVEVVDGEVVIKNFSMKEIS